MGSNLRRCISRAMVVVATLVAFSATAHATDDQLEHLAVVNCWHDSDVLTWRYFSYRLSELHAEQHFRRWYHREHAPTSANGIIRITGGDADVNTVLFSTPVLNPVMAIWSLGQGGINANFTFTNATPTFVSGGQSTEYLGAPITVLGNVVSGMEANGTVQFSGLISEISWTNLVSEDWYGFNVGAPVAPVPEPGTMVLLAGGFIGLAIYGKRRKNA